MSHFSKSPVLRPESELELKRIFEYANSNKLKIAFRGGGCSYGDASLNKDGIILDMQNYNQIMSWDKQTGIIKVQSGVTIQKLWEFSIEEGFWPPVVSGTMFPTLGGALSMNIHGKNNFAVGPIGEHVTEFRFMTANGKIIRCSKTSNKDIFYSAISGFGMLGCFLDISIKLKKIPSGKMKITPVPIANLDEMIACIEKEYKSSDYLVGWVDAFATGKSTGRGLIHKAVHLPASEDPDFPESLKVKNQILPTKFLGVIPKKFMWLFLLPFSNNPGMRLVNFVKFILGYVSTKPYLQGHAEFAFLLDYVPNWKFIYKPGSMIQYQVFIPKETASGCFKEIFKTCQEHNIIPFLAVFKKHRPDQFLLTHSVDGYSMAMDFPVTGRNKNKVWDLVYKLDEIVIRCKGKFYFAKDSTLRPEVAEKVFPKESLKKFKALKKRLDPNNIFQTDLYKRIFTPSKT
ncbi:MAG: FAD-binding oxidoreductase [Leptospira sp.]|nr:FAD-binding oxidoreductase [Leptospira sp.]